MVIYGGAVESHYLHSLPRVPAISELRIYPLNVHGIVVYQNAAEQKKLTFLRESGFLVFFVGFLIASIGVMMSKSQSVAKALYER